MYSKTLRIRIVLAVGSPIHANQVSQPTAQNIDQLHSDYLQAVERLFEQNKNKYGMGHATLAII
jgi:hypothetical protein